MGKIRNAYKTLMRKFEGKRHLRRPRCKWKDDGKMNFKEIGYEDVDWIRLAQNKVHRQPPCEQGDEPLVT
jgi:hypothetical protein